MQCYGLDLVIEVCRPGIILLLTLTCFEVVTHLNLFSVSSYKNEGIAIKIVNENHSCSAAGESNKLNVRKPNLCD